MAEKETKDREQTRSYSSRGGRTSYGEGRNVPTVRRNEDGGALASTTSPFGLMRRFMDDLDRMFSGFGSSNFLLGDPWSGTSAFTGVWQPQIETFRRDDQLVIRADLPGLDKENINVEYEDNAVIISGERQDEYNEERDDFYRSERSYGRFYRLIPVPDGVDVDKARARFQDGVLEITMPAPKEPERQTKRINIS